mmetsp:Transcript_118915/g.341641  ORF Transcript_118915/g.341641 Transcript_118915/m.341641 type:complete len:331 (+) Transcript_118915:1192-2184(+)
MGVAGCGTGGGKATSAVATERNVGTAGKAAPSMRALSAGGDAGATRLPPPTLGVQAAGKVGTALDATVPTGVGGGGMPWRRDPLGAYVAVASSTSTKCCGEGAGHGPHVQGGGPSARYVGGSSKSGSGCGSGRGGLDACLAGVGIMESITDGTPRQAPLLQDVADLESTSSSGAVRTASSRRCKAPFAAAISENARACDCRSSLRSSRSAASSCRKASTSARSRTAARRSKLSRPLAEEVLCIMSCGSQAQQCRRDSEETVLVLPQRLRAGTAALLQRLPAPPPPPRSGIAADVAMPPLAFALPRSLEPALGGRTPRPPLLAARMGTPAL